MTPRLQSAPEDGESQWLLVHALFASAVKGEGPGATPEGRAQLQDRSRRYIDGGGRYATVAARVAGLAHFFFGGALAAAPDGGATPGVFTEYSLRAATATSGRVTFTSTARTRCFVSGFVE